MRNSLLFRIAGPYVILVIVLVSAIGIYLNNFMKSSMLSSLEHQLMIEANMLSDQIEPYILNKLYNGEFSNIINRNSNLIDARITIIDINGSVIIDTETPAIQMENHLDRPEVIDVINTGFGKDIRLSGTLNQEYIYVAVPIKDINNETLAISRLSVPISDFSERLFPFQITIVFISVLVIIITFFISFLISRKTLTPIRNLLNAINNPESQQILFTESDHKKDEIETLSEYILNLTNRLKKQNEDIKREQKTLSVVLNQMTDAVIIVDQEGFVKLANPAAKLMFEIQNGHEREKTSVEFLRNHQINELIEKCQKEHVQKEMSVEINLNKMFVHVIAKPLEEIYSNGVLLIIQDFTRIHQLEKIRSDFVSNVSHELRTPIASLKALSDTLQEGALEDPPAARRFLQRMNVEIDNLTQMVQELLELSKIESGRISLKRSYLNPKDLVNNAIDRMIVQAERSGLQLKFEVPDEISYVYADPDRITQVFINLIHNAIKFTEPGGSISILVFEEKTGVIFCVRDTGVGIERDLQVRIFERFYKTDKARTSGGTGLGLSIVKHIIEAHNGKVWVKSSPGEGSSFFFSLPKKV
jgi:two-component system phosphate regulon sensor histidine kinase PhoR